MKYIQPNIELPDGNYITLSTDAVGRHWKSSRLDSDAYGS